MTILLILAYLACGVVVLAALARLDEFPTFEKNVAVDGFVATAIVAAWPLCGFIGAMTGVLHGMSRFAAWLQGRVR